MCVLLACVEWGNPTLSSWLWCKPCCDQVILRGADPGLWSVSGRQDFLLGTCTGSLCGIKCVKLELWCVGNSVTSRWILTRCLWKMTIQSRKCWWPLGSGQLCCSLKFSCHWWRSPFLWGWTFPILCFPCLPPVFVKYPVSAKQGCLHLLVVSHNPDGSGCLFFFFFFFLFLSWLYCVIWSSQARHHIQTSFMTYATSVAMWDP